MPNVSFAPFSSSVRLAGTGSFLERTETIIFRSDVVFLKSKSESKFVTG